VTEPAIVVAESDRAWHEQLKALLTARYGQDHLIVTAELSATAVALSGCMAGAAWTDESSVSGRS
jgi:hypothetical protein